MILDMKMKVSRYCNSKGLSYALLCCSTTPYHTRPVAKQISRKYSICICMKMRSLTQLLTAASSAGRGPLALPNCAAAPASMGRRVGDPHVSQQSIAAEDDRPLDELLDFITKEKSDKKKAKRARKRYVANMLRSTQSLAPFNNS